MSADDSPYYQKVDRLARLALQLPSLPINRLDALEIIKLHETDPELAILAGWYEKVTQAKWIAFSRDLQGRRQELTRISVEGSFPGEIDATAEMLAEENGIRVEDILVELAE